MAELARAVQELQAVRSLHSSYAQQLRQHLVPPPKEAARRWLAELSALRGVDGMEGVRREEMARRDMLRELQKREDLTAAMAALKETNGRLVEQIRLQSVELQSLQQQSQQDAQRLQRQLQRQQKELLDAQRDTTRKVELQSEMATKRQERVRAQMLGMARGCHAEGLRHRQVVTSLRAEHSTLRRELVSFREEVQVELSELLKRVVAQSKVQKASQERVEAQAAKQTLETQLREESEARRAASLSFRCEQERLHLALAHTEAAQAREMSALAAKLQALQRAQRAEEEAWLAEKETLERWDAESSEKLRAQQEELLQLKVKQESLEKQLLSSRSLAEQAEEELLDLKSRLWQSNSALQAARSSEEHLQQQLMELDQAWQRSSQADLQQEERDLEREAQMHQRLREAEVQAAQKHLEDLEEEVRQQNEELRSLEKEVKKEEESWEALQGEATVVQLQIQQVEEQRRCKEDELSELRRRHALASAELEVECEDSHLQLVDAELDVGRLAERLQQLQRLRQDVAVKDAARRSASENELRADQDELQALKRRLLSAQAAQNQVPRGDFLTALEGDYAARFRQLEERRRQHCAALQEELRKQEQSADEARKTLQQVEQEGSQELQAAQEEGARKLLMLQEAKVTAEEKRRSELKSHSEFVAAAGRRVRELEMSCGEMRARLAQNGEHLQWLRQQIHLEDNTATSRMRFEVAALDRSIQQALDAEASWSRDLEDATRLRREEPPQGWQAKSLASPLSPWRQEADSFSALQQKLESHVQRLQHHTEELRTSLRDRDSSGMA